MEEKKELTRASSSSLSWQERGKLLMADSTPSRSSFRSSPLSNFLSPEAASAASYTNSTPGGVSSDDTRTLATAIASLRAISPHPTSANHANRPTTRGATPATQHGLGSTLSLSLPSATSPSSSSSGSQSHRSSVPNFSFPAQLSPHSGSQTQRSPSPARSRPGDSPSHGGLVHHHTSHHRHSTSSIPLPFSRAKDSEHAFAAYAQVASLLNRDHQRLNIVEGMGMVGSGNELREPNFGSTGVIPPTLGPVSALVSPSSLRAESNESRAGNRRFSGTTNQSSHLQVPLGNKSRSSVGSLNFSSPADLISFYGGGAPSFLQPHIQVSLNKTAADMLSPTRLTRDSSGESVSSITSSLSKVDANGRIHLNFATRALTASASNSSLNGSPPALLLTPPPLNVNANSTTPTNNSQALSLISPQRPPRNSRGQLLLTPTPPTGAGGQSSTALTPSPNRGGGWNVNTTPTLISPRPHHTRSSSGGSNASASPPNIDSSPSPSASTASIPAAPLPGESKSHSSFVEASVSAACEYEKACARYNLQSNSILLRMFQDGLAERRTWDCGYLYLGHRGVLPLLDVLNMSWGKHVEELSLRGTGLRNIELMKLIQLTRGGAATAVDYSTLTTTELAAAMKEDSKDANSGFHGMPVLRTLDLGDNPLSESGGAALLLLVNLNPAVTRISLDGTRVDSVTQRAISSACLAKLQLKPSASKLSGSKRRYMGLEKDKNDFGNAAVEAWKNKLLENFMRKGELASLAAAEAEEGKNEIDAAARERDRQTIRLLLRCLQTDNDIVGLLLRFDETKHPEVWRDVRVVRRFVKRLIETGHHRKAFELADRYVNPRPKKASDATTGPDGKPIPPPPNFQNDQILQWWRVYALARSRNFTDAFKEINLLLPKNLAPAIHANLLGLAGMLRKCLYESGMRADFDSTTNKMTEEDANESANLYLASYETAHGLMEGIAAATMLRLGGKDEQSTKLAKKLLKQATTELALLDRSRGPEDVERRLNLYSALAEANINLQRPNAAYKYYQQAVEVAGTNVNHLAQLQQNLQLLSNARVRIGDVMQLFHAGNVCVFSGLAVDHPIHDVYAFPPERDLELEISYQIDLQIEQLQVNIGFVSLACGSEILFAEKMLEKKYELHVVLPFHLEDFFASSIDYGLSTMYRWRARAQSILKRCEVHYVTTERFLNDLGLFNFQSMIMEGLAMIRARELGVGPPIALAVLDSSMPFSNCRPNNFIRNWKAKKASTCSIDLQDVRRRVLSLGVGLSNSKTLVKRFSEAAQVTQEEDVSGNSTPGMVTNSGPDTPRVEEITDSEMFTAKPSALTSQEATPRRSNAHRHLEFDAPMSPVQTGGAAATMQHTTSKTGKFLTAMQFASKITRVVKYMMFADVEPTATMNEENTPVFFKTFFKLLEKARKESKVSPFYANTWGSGLYFIFHTVDECAEFSLHLLQVVAKMDWHSLGLPPATACLGMHGGPLFPGYNPVEEKDFYFGAHVCRAARIKAVTPAGYAYASEQFVAALAVADAQRKRFFFEYLGHRDLAKSYDRCPLYRLCRIEDVRKHALINATVTTSSTSTLSINSSAVGSPMVGSGDPGGGGGGGASAALTRSPRPSLATVKESLIVTTTATDTAAAAAPPADDLNALDPNATPNTQMRRIKERRQRDKREKGQGFAPTPFSAGEVGLLNSGPLTPQTIERANPFFVSKLVEHYLSLDTNAEGLLYWEDVTLLHALVSRLISLGQTHVAFLVVQKALGYDSAWKDDLRLKYYRVLALRHTQKADEFMKELQETIKSHPNPNTIAIDLRAAVLSLSGRMHKDKYYESIRNHEPNIQFAHESAREYFFSYELKKSSFPAINAATMLLLSKQKERARALAKFSVRLVADELLARSQQIWNLSSEADKTLAAKVLTEGGRGDKVLGDGTVIDEKTQEEEKAKAERGEVNGKTSEKAPGEGAHGGPVGEEYWMYAAMGEAYLVLEEQDKCISWYKHALEKAAGHMGSISTMYRNFLLLQSCMEVPKELHELFLSSLGRVLVCAAHPIIPWSGPYKPDKIRADLEMNGVKRIEEGEEETEDSDDDHPLETSPKKSISSPSKGSLKSTPSAPPIHTLVGPLRFYRMMEERVLLEIRRHLDTARPTVAFVFLLTDTDLFFAESLIERGVEVHVLLVYTKSVFLEHCVENGFERLHNWKGRLEIVFKRSVLHFVTRDKQKQQKQLLYHFNRRVLQGLTILRAQQLDCGDPLALCVLDGLDNFGQPLPESNNPPLLDRPQSSTGNWDSNPAQGARSFPPLDRSSAGLEFPLQWCSLNPEHTCTVINLNAIRAITSQEYIAAERDSRSRASSTLADGTSTPSALPNLSSDPNSNVLPPLRTGPTSSIASTGRVGRRLKASKAPSLPMVRSDTLEEQKAEHDTIVTTPVMTDDTSMNETGSASGNEGEDEMSPTSAQVQGRSATANVIDPRDTQAAGASDEVVALVPFVSGSQQQFVETVVKSPFLQSVSLTKRSRPIHPYAEHRGTTLPTIPQSPLVTNTTLEGDWSKIILAQETQERGNAHRLDEESETEAVEDQTDNEVDDVLRVPQASGYTSQADSSTVPTPPEGSRRGSSKMVSNLQSDSESDEAEDEGATNRPELPTDTLINLAVSPASGKRNSMILRQRAMSNSDIDSESDSESAIGKLSRNERRFSDTVAAAASANISRSSLNSSKRSTQTNLSTRSSPPPDEESPKSDVTSFSQNGEGEAERESIHTSPKKKSSKRSSALEIELNKIPTGPNSIHQTPHSRPSASMPCSPSLQSFQISLEQLKTPIAGLANIIIPSAVPNFPSLDEESGLRVPSTGFPNGDLSDATSSPDSYQSSPNAPVMGVSASQSWLLPPSVYIMQPGEHQSLAGTPEVRSHTAQSALPSPILVNGEWIDPLPPGLALGAPAVAMSDGGSKSLLQPTSPIPLTGDSTSPVEVSTSMSDTPASPISAAAFALAGGGSKPPLRLTERRSSDQTAGARVSPSSPTYVSSSRVPQELRSGPADMKARSQPGSIIRVNSAASSPISRPRQLSNENAKSTSPNQQPVELLVLSRQMPGASLLSSKSQQDLTGALPIAPSPLQPLVLPLLTFNSSATALSPTHQAGENHGLANAVVSTTIPSHTLSRATSRAQSRRPSIGNLSELIVPSSHPTVMSVVQLPPTEPHFVDSGLGGVILSHDAEEEDVSAKAKLEADAIAKAVEATYAPDPEPEPSTTRPSTSLKKPRNRRAASTMISSATFDMKELPKEGEKLPKEGEKEGDKEREPTTREKNRDRSVQRRESVASLSRVEPRPSRSKSPTAVSASSSLDTSRLLSPSRMQQQGDKERGIEKEKDADSDPSRSQSGADGPAQSQQSQPRRSKKHTRSNSQFMPLMDPRKAASSRDYYKARAEAAANNFSLLAMEIKEKKQAEEAERNAKAAQAAATLLASFANSSGDVPQSYTARPQRRSHRKTNSTPLDLARVKQVLLEEASKGAIEEGDRAPSHEPPTPLDVNEGETDSESQTSTASASLSASPVAHGLPAPTGSPSLTRTRSRSSSQTPLRGNSRAHSPSSDRRGLQRAISGKALKRVMSSARSGRSSPRRSFKSISAMPTSPSFIGPTLTEASYSRAVRFIIFADVRNYSKLSQEQTPLFNTHFLNIVRQVIDLFLEPPPGTDAKDWKSALMFYNTWGDGLFVVFSDPAQCGRFALVLLQKVHQTDWKRYGLPSELTMRVGMHAGPVLVGWDPVVRHMNYFGPHVLYAQLIEPITTPGCAFATAQFASCLATSPEAIEFKCEYIGSSVLEKEFADEDYNSLSTKEKQDFARCHLYHVTENKAYSARGLDQDAPTRGPSIPAFVPNATLTMTPNEPKDYTESPSLTHSLLRIEELKTRLDNQQHEHKRTNSGYSPSSRSMADPAGKTYMSPTASSSDLSLRPHKTTAADLISNTSSPSSASASRTLTPSQIRSPILLARNSSS